MTDVPPFDYARYSTRRGDEWMMLRGPRNGPRVLILPPLLNEANQCRALVVDLARHLALAGVRTAIPELPGTGESTFALGDTRWSDWRDAAAAAAEALCQDGPPPVVAALRGGALLDDACTATAWWRFAEAPGAALLRPLERAQRLRNASAGPQEGGAPDTLAGFHLHGELLEALRAAVLAPLSGPLRTMPFDGKGVPVWRRSEPTNDPTLAGRMAQDLLAWMSSCAA